MLTHLPTQSSILKPKEKNNETDLMTILDDFSIKKESYFFETKFPIDVVIPVYNGYSLLLKLFESLKNTINPPYRLIVVDDCSTDKRIRAFLHSVRIDFKNFFLIEHKENVGFIKSVNEAIRHTQNHFVILNSDTEVPPNWLQRLMYPIFSDETIASATPFTNAGTICSFPYFCRDSETFEEKKIAELDEFFQLVKAKKNYIELPTGIGFCMGMNKNVVAEIGIFDEATFGRGYAEENDWCRRAVARGYRNVMVPNLFVYHKHGGSFSPEEKKRLSTENHKKLCLKHPNYEEVVEKFSRADPARNIRNLLIVMISSKMAKRTFLVFNRAYGGTIQKCTEDFIKKKLDEKNALLVITRNYEQSFADFSATYFYKEFKISFAFKHFSSLGRLVDYITFHNVVINNRSSITTLFVIKTILKFPILLPILKKLIPV